MSKKIFPMKLIELASQDIPSGLVGQFDRSTILRAVDLPGQPEYRWNGSKWVASVESTVDPVTGGIEAEVAGVKVNFSDAVTGRVVDGIALPAAWAMGYFGQHKCSLIPELGPYPNFMREFASGGLPFVKNHLGYAVETVFGEALFWGARRVRNLIPYSNSLSNAWWSTGGTLTEINDSNYELPGGVQGSWKLEKAAAANVVHKNATALVLGKIPHVYSVLLRKGSLDTAELRIWIPSGATLATKIVTLTDEWQRYAIAGTPDGSAAYSFGVAPGSFAGAVAGDIRFAFEQLGEDPTGSGVPDEYVSRGASALTRFWHGAAVDGVKYFDTANANTVDANGLVTEAVGAKLTTPRGVATFYTTTQWITDNASFTGWTATRATLAADASIKSPDGKNGFYRFTEDTTAGATHIATLTLAATLATYDGVTANYSLLAKYGGDANGRQWMRLFFVDIAGATQYAYFDVKNGVAGSASIGSVYVEPWAEGAFRVMWSVPIGAGTAAPTAGIGMASADGAAAYTGTGKYNWLWCPNFTTGQSASSSRSIPVPPYFTGASPNSLAGQAFEISVRGMCGRTNFGVYSDWTPYFSAESGDKKNYTGVGYMHLGSPTQYQYNHSHRCGLSVRPPVGGAENNINFAFDIYNGDPNLLYFWKPNTDYPAGAHVIPTDTPPDNDSGKKMFTCVVPGLSGASEPAWNTTYTTPPDTTSNLTVDGAARWQCNIGGGLAGTYEPYSGAEMRSTLGFMGHYRAAWMIRADDYYCYINGEACTKQTEPQPINPTKGFVLDYRPETLYFGGLGGNFGGVIPESVTSAAQVMPTLCAFHKNIAVFKQALSEPTTKAITATGIVP